MTPHYRDIKLGIVCPMANEKETAADFVKEVLAVCRKHQFGSIHFYASLDRVSQDGTIEILKALSQQEKELEVVFSPENKNVVDAYKRGYREALAHGCDWILEIDAGYSHKPSDIPKFFSTAIAGDYDCVFGSRFIPGAHIINGSFKKFLLSYGGTQLCNVLLGTKLKDMTSGLELFKKTALTAILEKGIHSTGPFFQTEIRTFAHRFKIVEVPITYDSSTSHAHNKVIIDSLKNLKRLFFMRLKNQLGF